MASLKMLTNSSFFYCNVEVVVNPLSVLWSNMLETSDHIEYFLVPQATCVYILYISRQMQILIVGLILKS